MLAVVNFAQSGRESPGVAALGAPAVVLVSSGLSSTVCPWRIPSSPTSRPACATKLADAFRAGVHVSS